MKNYLRKLLCLSLTLAILLPTEVLELGAVDWIPPRVNSYDPDQSDVNIDLATQPLVDFSVTASDPKSANNEAIFDYGQYGVYTWDPDTGIWTQIHTVSPKQMVTGDLDGDGKDEAIVDYDTYGVYIMDYDTGIWTQIHTVSPEQMATGDLDGDGKDEAIVDYGSYGVYALDYDTGIWTQIHTASPEQMVMGDFDSDGKDEVMFNYGTYGVYAWDPDTGIWTQIHTVSPEQMVTGDLDGDGKYEVMFDYGNYGVYTWDPDTGIWTQIHTVSPEQMVTGDLDGDGKDEAIADCGADGVYTWDPDTGVWTQIHTASPEQMVMGDFDSDGKDEVMFNYGTYGVYAWDPDTGIWTQIHTASPEEMAAGDFDGDSLTYTWKFDAQTLGSVSGNTLYTGGYSALATVGDHTVEVSISDGRNTPAVQQWNLHITRSNLPPTINSYLPNQAEVSVDLTFDPLPPFSVSATDPDSDPLSYTWKFDSQTLGSVTGNTLYASDYTSLATVGDHNIEVLVNDGHNPAVSHSWILHVTQTQNGPPTIDSFTPNQADITIDLNTQSLIDFGITTSDPEGDPITRSWKFDSQTLLSVTGDTLQVSDYSALAAVGDHAVEAAVTDTYHPAVTHQWTLHVIRNDAPSIDSFSPADAVLSLIQGDSQNFQITASDPNNGDTLSYSWTVNGAPAGTDSNSFNYTANQMGQFTIRVTVTDGIVTSPPYHEWTVNVESVLEATVKRTFRYFWDEADPTTGLVRDRLLVDAADPSVDTHYNKASIAATGFGLAAMCVAAENYGNGSDPDWQIMPQQLADRVEAILDTLLTIQANQAPAGDATWGKDGFFYHFVNMADGACYGGCEVSSIDTAIVVAGALTAGEYFNSIRPSITTKARQVYSNVKWTTFVDTTPGKNYKQFYKQWMFGSGYNNGHWDYNDESLILYLLAIGSPNIQYAVGDEYYYSPWHKLGSYGDDGKALVQTWFGSLFAYQFPHAFFDFRDKHDARNVDWWQNTREATIANRQFCIDQDGAYGYNQNIWGLSSSYVVEGAAYAGEFGAPPLDNPPGPIHDGTVNPSVVASAISMLPQEVEEALVSMRGDADLWRADKYGFVGSFKNSSPRAYADYYVGIDLGATLATISNHVYSGIIWNNFMNAQTRFGNMNDLLAQLNFRPNSDPKYYIEVDDISEKSQFAYGLIDSTSQDAQVSFNLTQVVQNGKYLLAVHSFMNDSAGDYDVQVNVSVNGTDRGDQTFSHLSGIEDPIKYIEIDSLDLQAGENIVTLRWLSGASWLAWKNIEVSSPTVTNTWTITRTVFGNEYRLDDTYYAGHAVTYGAVAYKTFEQALNRVTDPCTEIMFYLDDLSAGRKIILDPAFFDSSVYVDVTVNGQLAADNLDVSSTQEAVIPVSMLRLGWNVMRIETENAGGQWVIWDTLQLELGPSQVPPQGLVAASFGKTLVNLRWQSVSGTSIRYNVYRSQAAGGPYVKVNSSELTSPQYQDGGLQNGATYYYVVTVYESANPSEESGYSGEVTVMTGNYEVDYGDGHEPNAFGGATLDNSGSPLGDGAYAAMARYNGDAGKVRQLILAANAKNTVGLNNSDINDATIFSFRVKGTAGGEKFRIKLADGSGGQSSITLENPVANTWQEMHLYINDTFPAVNLANVASLEITEVSGQPATLYLDEVEFNTVDLAGDKLDVKMRTGTNDTQVTALSFGNNPAGTTAVLSQQYLEINYTSQGTWGIQIYTNNKSPDASPRFTGTGDIVNGLVGTRNSGYRVPLLWQVWQGKKGYYNGSETPEFDTTVEDGDRAEFAFVMDKGDSNWINSGYQRNYRTLFNSKKELGAPVPLANPPPGYWPRIGTLGDPLYVYLTADFTNVPAQAYTTNKLTLDIYHE